MPPKKINRCGKKRDEAMQFREKMKLQLTARKLEEKRARDRRGNMSENRLEKKRAANRRENMSEQRLKRKRDADRRKKSLRPFLQKILLFNA